MRTNRCEVERFAQPVFAQPHPVDFPTRDLRQDWMRGTGIGLFGVVVLSAVFFDSTSSWCSVPMFVIHSMHAGFLLVSRTIFFSPITVRHVLFWRGVANYIRAHCERSCGCSEHGLHAIRRSTERPVLSRQVVVTSASAQALVLRADS
jgi:hypothetical protein